MNISEQSIRDAAIEGAVHQLTEELTHDEDIEEAVKSDAAKIIAQQVDARVSEILEGELIAIVFPNTNSFGEVKGPDRTFKEFIDDEVKKHLYQNVDYTGKTSTEHYGTKMPRLQFLVQESTKHAIDEMVKAAAIKIREEIGTILGKQVKEKIDETLKLLLNR